MKNKRLYRAAAALLAVGMTAALAGCGSTAEVESTAENADAAATATAETATAESADESAYDYLADFHYGDGFDENGYLKDVTAADYVTLPDDYAAITIDAALADARSFFSDEWPKLERAVARCGTRPRRRSAWRRFLDSFMEV